MISDESVKVIRERIRELNELKSKEEAELALVIPDLNRYVDKKNGIEAKILRMDSMIQDMEKDIKNAK